MPGKGKINNLQLEAVFLLLHGDWTVTEMMGKIGVKERTSLCLAMRRIELHGIAKIVGTRDRAPLWGLARPQQ